MSEEIRPGYYKDHSGEWRRDRRTGGDRRRRNPGAFGGEDRRVRGRRRDDLLDREHREMIQEALDDFAAGDDED